MWWTKKISNLENFRLQHNFSFIFAYWVNEIGSRTQFALYKLCTSLANIKYGTAVSTSQQKGPGHDYCFFTEYACPPRACVLWLPPPSKHSCKDNSPASNDESLELVPGHLHFALLPPSGCVKCRVPVSPCWTLCFGFLAVITIKLFLFGHEQPWMNQVQPSCTEARVIRVQVRDRQPGSAWDLENSR